MVAAKLRTYLTPHSSIHEKYFGIRVQDAYTIRCIPQVCADVRAVRSVR